jgi:hypothetical protein
LKALEADLQHAELARKERTLAVRYHKIKFFGKCSFRHNICVSYGCAERQKVVRKVNQAKKRLASADGDTGTLEATLFDLRIDLNYILVSRVNNNSYNG